MALWGRVSVSAPLAILAIGILLVVVCDAHSMGHGIGEEEHRCSFDKLMEQQLRSGGKTHIVELEEEADSNMSRVYRASNAWESIRIEVFFEDLDESRQRYCTSVGQTVPNFMGGTATCSSEDILDADKKNILIGTLIPDAVQLHAERLLIKPLTTAMKVPAFNDNICGSFTVPTSHQVTGVSGADFMLYVAAAPTEGNTIAWALTCASLVSNGRPVVGMTNISPKYISDSVYTQRVVAHEIMHALGFNGQMFTSKKMVSKVKSLRGVSDVPVVTSPNVVQRMGNQYGCEEVPGMELETSGGAGTAGSHWKLRNAKDELMCGYAGFGRYTAISIGAMEDLGFYKGVYDKAETMTWGLDAGCNLFNGKCVKDSVTRVPSMFCDDDRGPARCTSNRLGLGTCLIGQYNQNLPAPYRYFSQPSVGGYFEAADYCPFYEDSYKTCAGSDRANMPASVSPSDEARCVDLSSTLQAVADGVCVDVQCDANAKTYKIQLAGSTSWVNCPIGGEVDAGDISPTLFYNGMTVNCPPFIEMCPSTFNSLALDVKIGSFDGVAHPAGMLLWVGAMLVLVLYTV